MNNEYHGYLQESGGYRKAVTQLWGAHLRFFRQLCTAAKVEEVARLAIEALAAGQCVVIGLQSTGAFALHPIWVVSYPVA